MNSEEKDRRSLFKSETARTRTLKGIKISSIVKFILDDYSNLYRIYAWIVKGTDRLRALGPWNALKNRFSGATTNIWLNESDKCHRDTAESEKSRSSDTKVHLLSQTNCRAVCFCRLSLRKVSPRTTTTHWNRHERRRHRNANRRFNLIFIVIGNHGAGELRSAVASRHRKKNNIEERNHFQFIYFLSDLLLWETSAGAKKKFFFSSTYILSSSSSSRLRLLESGFLVRKVFCDFFFISITKNGSGRGGEKTIRTRRRPGAYFSGL